jgi:hypothetical protein
LKTIDTKTIRGCSFYYIDFSVNQYSKAIFEERFKDAVSDTEVPVDKNAVRCF